MADFFDFWAEAGGERVHPRDRRVLDRLPHHFDLTCYGSSYYGPLRTAPVVLLYLSLGLTDFDREEGATGSGAARYRAMRRGDQPLPGSQENPPVHKWWAERTAAFGPPDIVRSKLAVLNLAAYHAAKFSDWALLAPLASTRAALDYAQTVLFPQAEAGERVVICLRAASCWGLPRGQGLGGAPGNEDDPEGGGAGTPPHKPGGGLFSPPTTPGGHMHKGPMRNAIVERVQTHLCAE